MVKETWSIMQKISSQSMTTSIAGNLLIPKGMCMQQFRRGGQFNLILRKAIANLVGVVLVWIHAHS